MCLGIPGRIVELGDHPDLVTADVFGARRQISVGIIEDTVRPGDWVLIHVGFALSKLDEGEVRLATQSLDMLGGGASESGVPEPESGFIEQWENEEAVQWA